MIIKTPSNYRIVGKNIVIITSAIITKSLFTPEERYQQSFKSIESSFSTTILLGNGSKYISSSDISNIFNHDRMSILKEQNLEFTLVIIDSHDSKESKAFSSVKAGLIRNKLFVFRPTLKL